LIVCFFIIKNKEDSPSAASRGKPAQREKTASIRLSAPFPKNEKDVS